jgi:hypothetical protein
VALVDQRRGLLGTRLAPVVVSSNTVVSCVLSVVTFLAVGFAVSVDVRLTEHE